MKRYSTPIAAPADPDFKNEIEHISDLWHEVVQILAEDRSIENSDHADRVLDLVESRQENLYQDLIRSLTQLDLPVEEAHQRWVDILKHKQWMSERLGRNAGIQVAALDYLNNVTGELKNVTMVDVYKYKQIQKDAVTDWLTGLYLKNHVLSLMEQELCRAQRTESPVTAFFFDIDYFKIYNDTFGHLAGDALLKELVATVRQAVRKYDIFGRYGGEEFIIFFPDTTILDAHMIAESIREIIEQYPFSGALLMPEKRVSISGGIAGFPANGREVRTILHAADNALYRSKQNGRNRITVY